MSSLTIDSLEAFIRKVGAFVLGTKPRVHRIPFGPIRGRKIYLSFHISPKMWLGLDEPWIARLVQDCIEPGDVVYDIGAHVGYTCIVFAQRLENTGAVHAFEILSSVANYLKKTIESNSFSNVTIHNVGLSDREQNLRLQVGETMMTSLYSVYRPRKNEMESVHTVTLDRYVKDNHLPSPSLIKMDIEGAEYDCLSGGLQIIQECFPKMIIEFHNKELLEKGYYLLSPLGYTLTTEKQEVICPAFLLSTPHFHASVLCVPGKGQDQEAQNILTRSPVKGNGTAQTRNEIDGR